MPRNRKYYKRKFGELTNTYYHHLDLRPYSDLDDEGFAYIIEHVKRIDMLDLHETDVTDKSIKLLPALEYVKELRLKDCYLITDDCVSDLNRIKGLTFLYLKGTSITSHGLLNLTGQPFLKELHFSDAGDNINLPTTMLRLKQQMPECTIVINSKDYQFP